MARFIAALAVALVLWSLSKKRGRSSIPVDVEGQPSRTGGESAPSVQAGGRFADDPTSSEENDAGAQVLAFEPGSANSALAEPMDMAPAAVAAPSLAAEASPPAERNLKVRQGDAPSAGDVVDIEQASQISDYPGSPEQSPTTVAIAIPSISVPIVGADQGSVPANPERTTLRNTASDNAKAPKYQGLKPGVSQTRRPRGDRKASSRENGTDSTYDSEAHLMMVHLVLDRHGDVRILSLLPDRRGEMPDELEVTGTQGNFTLTSFRDDDYQDVIIPDIGSVLLEGVAWRGASSANRRWRWVLSGREVYVLASGLLVGLGGFVSVPRLLLNQDHLVLARKTLQVEVVAALLATGCAEPTVIDETATGMPSGWVLLRGVRPLRAVPMRPDQDILNALCPLAEIEPHFEGGVRLESQTWLAGHPPRIRFVGEVDESFAPKIDGHPALLSDGGYVAPGWDNDGPHQVLYSDQSVIYSLRQCSEVWDDWPAYDFGTGAVICGACVLANEREGWREVRVPRTNPVLIGAEAGQLFRCHPRSDLRMSTWLAMVPFEPIWAVPSNPAHLDKRTAHVVALGRLEPVRRTNVKGISLRTDPAVAAWCSAISEAGRKGLRVADTDAGAVDLWREYRREAKRLRRAMR
jgi:hypothetical protein